ncbi:MAG: LamG domain-containing protein [Lentisphaeria bacterium]|nr:LamG domain-containing protein [Lentisphaeria bacterium]
MRKTLTVLAAVLVAFCAGAGNAQVRYRRTVMTGGKAPEGAGGKQVRIFAEWAPYWLDQNFMGYWIERPLFAMPEYRENREAGHRKELESMKRYGIQGLASLDYVASLKQQTAWEIKAAVPGIEHMVVIPAYAWPKNYEKIRDAVAFAVKSPLTPRVDGKVLLSCYGTIQSAQAKALGDKLRSDPEIGDSFLLPCSMPFLEFHADFVRYRDMETDPPRWFLEKYRAAVREALDNSDGLVLYVKDAVREPGEQMWNMILLPHFEKYMWPIIREELAREKYRDKKILCPVIRGYVNHLSGKIVAEYGTSQLRRYLDLALQIRPDAIILFEWNEANENTSFQPLNFTSWAVARVVRYYSGLLNGRPAEPLEGDDTSLPNLVLSVRRRAKLGELINYEVLNVPDGVFSGVICFQLRLRDENRNVLAEFPLERVDAANLTAVSYRVATDDFKGALAITPELLVITPDGTKRTYTGFDSTILTASANVIYNETKQALRDLLIPQKENFTVTAEAGGTYRLDADFAASERLLRLEVTDNHTEVAACDPKQEFDYEKDAVFLGYFSAMGLLLKTEGTFRLHNVSDWTLRSDHLAHGVCNTVKKEGDTATCFTYFSWMRAPFILTVPRTEVENAELEITYPDPVGTQKIRLKDVWEKEHYAAAFGRHVRLHLARAARLPDYTFALNANQGTINRSVFPYTRYPVYQLTAVSESGRVWRSRPIVPTHPRGAKVPMTVFSEFANAPVKLPVAADFIPRIEYRFTPEYGALLTNAFDPWFNAELGGGFNYLEPMHKSAYPRLPKDFQSFAPRWVNEEGNWLLRFDGVSNYVNLPRETMPRGAYAIEMEIRTPGNREQVLLRSYSNREPGTLQTVLTADNELIATSALNSWNAPFRTGLKVPTDRWCRIRVNYDLAHLTFEVDGQRKTFPFTGRGFIFKPGCFGGTDEPNGAVGDKTGYFRGDLRRLTIIHNNTEEKK